MKHLAIALILFFSVTTFADYAEDLAVIKQLGHSVEPDGAICEEVAKLRFQEKYPAPQFMVVNGVEYSEKSGLTLGELDLIVIDNSQQMVKAVAEVKCWKSPKGGLKKAKEQRQRFITNLNSKKSLVFSAAYIPSLKLSKNQFSQVEEFFVIGQSETIAEGYDYELEYSLAELKHLRKEILECQAFNTCPKPQD